MHHVLHRKGMRWLAGLAALGLLLVAGPDPAEPGRGAAAGPRLELSPGRGTAGAAAFAHGTGFPWGAAGGPVWADKTVGASFPTTAWGRLAAEFAVPAARPGAPAVTDRAGGLPRAATFKVTTGGPALASPRRTYYVDSRGGDDRNSGMSKADAWKTLGKANQAPLAPGDRLLFRRGASWTGSLTVAASGTSANPIVIGSYGTGLLPVIRGGSSCVVLSGMRLVLREIHADRCSWSGIEVAGSSNWVENSLITRNAAGIYVRAGANNNHILGNTLRENNRMSVLTESRTSDDSGAFGVLLQGDGTEVAYNSISGSDAFSYDYGRDGAAVEVYGGRNNHVHHNVAIDNDAFAELGSSRASDNTFAYNVVRSSLSTSVFLVTRGAGSGYGPVLRTVLVNNTVRLTGRSSQGFVCHSGCGHDILTMRNNIIQAVWKVGYADAPFDEDYDLFFDGPLQFSKGDHSVVADPRFADPAGGDLRPRASSPAIDRGVDVGYGKDLDGVSVPADGDGDGRATPDVGAFEYHR